VRAILLTFFLLPAAAHAANVTVGCPGGSGTYPSIGAALTAIGQTGPSVITVTGTCKENVSLNNARSLTFIAGAGGAKIVEPQDSDAFDVVRSQDITLQNLEIVGTPGSMPGFGGGGVSITEASDLHILGCNIHDNEAGGVSANTGSLLFLRNTTIHNNTPFDGLDVAGNSTADVFGSTIQNNGSPGVNGGVGVFVTRDSVVRFRRTNLIQNNADVGIVVRLLSTVVFEFTDINGTTVQGHNINGILVQEGGHLQVNSPGTVIQGNGVACPLDTACGGIFAAENSTLEVSSGTISGNQGAGISVQQGTNVHLNGATVSNNSGDGVHIQWISIGGLQFRQHYNW
jgi:hypothetical protein